MVVHKQFLQHNQEPFNILLRDDDRWLDPQHILVPDTYNDVFLFQSLNHFSGVDIFLEMHSQVQSTTSDFRNVIGHLLQFMFQVGSHNATVLNQTALLKLCEDWVCYKAGRWVASESVEVGTG